MPITQQQLADRLGVSQMAVSFALNNKPGVNEKTRRRILQAALETGYRPNAAARATRRGSTSNIELIFGLDEEVSRLPVGLLESLHEHLLAQSWHLSLSRLPDEQLTDERFLPRILREVAADGLLVNYTHGFPPKLAQLIDHHRIPAIWLNAPMPHRCVRPDDTAAGRIAAEHLLKRGCRKPAFYVLANNSHHSVQLRREGFLAALDEAGVSGLCESRAPRPYAEIRHDLLSDQRLALTQAWLAESDRPDGVVAYSQTEASMLMLAAARLGLRLPHDLQLITVADDVSPQFGEAITTVTLPWDEIGRVAVDRLSRCINEPGGQNLTAVEIAPSLKQGVTTLFSATA